MPAEAPLPLDRNPFATRFTRPAASPYVFPAGTDAVSLVARLHDSAWWGQITGPHGSGKSTLVQTLLPHLKAAGRVVEFYALYCDHETSPAGLRRASGAGWNSATQIVVDGYEQLGWLQRIWFQWRCRRRGAGLLVTAHDDLGLPPLWQTEASVELTQRVVVRLLGDGGADWLRRDEVDRLFAVHGGNVREVLFALYDLYEQRREGQL